MHSRCPEQLLSAAFISQGGLANEELHLTCPSVKVSPLEHSMPNVATMSPALASVMSSMSLLCMRTSLGTCMYASSELSGSAHLGRSCQTLTLEVPSFHVMGGQAGSMPQLACERCITSWSQLQAQCLGPHHMPFSEACRHDHTTVALAGATGQSVFLPSHACR